METVRVLFEGLGIQFDISRVAFTIPIGENGITVYWYGLLIALGFVLAMVFGIWKAKDFGIDYDRMADVVIAGLVGAIIGARLYYVLFNLEDYHSFMDVINIQKGGLAIYGGIIGALTVGGVFCKIRKVKLLPMFDLTAMGLFIGQAVGRWGNFFNQEAFGSNTTMPWGMYSTETNAYLAAQSTDLLKIGVEVDPSAPVHPCFLYESILCALGFVFLWWLKSRRKFDGQIFYTYLVWYGTVRFFIEGLRTDSLMIGSIRVSQLLSAIIAVGALFIIIYKFVFGKKVVYANTEEAAAMLEELEQKRKNKKKKKEDALAEEEEEEEDDILSGKIIGRRRRMGYIEKYSDEQDSDSDDEE